VSPRAQLVTKYPFEHSPYGKRWLLTGNGIISEWSQLCERTSLTVSRGTDNIPANFFLSRRLDFVDLLANMRQTDDLTLLP